MNDSLQTSLTRLRLSGMATTLDVRLQEAAGHQLGHGEFLELVLHDELLVHDQRLIECRTRAAGFRERRTLDGGRSGIARLVEHTRAHPTLYTRRRQRRHGRRTRQRSVLVCSSTLNRDIWPPSLLYKNVF